VKNGASKLHQSKKWIFDMIGNLLKPGRLEKIIETVIFTKNVY
jgi:hypothetical protein